MRIGLWICKIIPIRRIRDGGIIFVLDQLEEIPLHRLFHGRPVHLCIAFGETFLLTGELNNDSHSNRLLFL